MLASLEQAIEVIKAGATTINLPDTVGYMLPFEMKEKVEKVRNAKAKENYFMDSLFSFYFFFQC